MDFILSQTIIYRSKLSANEALARIADAIEPKGISTLDYWTKTGKYFKGKVYENKFELTYDARAGNIFNPVLIGVIEKDENGCIVTVILGMNRNDWLFLVAVPILSLIGFVLLIRNEQYIDFVLLCIFGIVFFIVNILRFKWRCMSSTIYLEEAFKVKGEKQ